MIIINPFNGRPLKRLNDQLRDELGNNFPVIDGVPRIISGDNYTVNFGMQWNKFKSTQLDIPSFNLSKSRFFAQTNWNPKDINELNVLEVGSGAGRFSRILLTETNCNLWSIDYSSAVLANMQNNGMIAPSRFNLFQASVYEMPFPNDSFDKVFCFGVLQHTPDFELSVKALIAKAKIGSEIVVDFYPIKGWWTKFHSKYFLRPFTKRIPHEYLLKIITFNINWLIIIFDFLVSLNLGFLTRFLPITDLRGFPTGLEEDKRREWAILDTFDGFSPEYDQPKRIVEVERMFEKFGAKVTFAGFIKFEGGSAAVVRAIKKSHLKDFNLF
jgi:SAM-dependent methyltransferase